MIMGPPEQQEMIAFVSQPVDTSQVYTIYIDLLYIVNLGNLIMSFCTQTRQVEYNRQFI